MKKLLMFILTLCPLVAMAEGSYSGTVRWIHVLSDGIVLVHTRTGTTIDNPPACATEPNRFAFDSKTLAGQSQLKLLLTLYAERNAVYLKGTGACGLGYNAEEVSYVSTADL